MKQEFTNHKDGVTCLACSPELWLLASGGTDMKVILYDLRTLKHEYTFKRMKSVISAIDFLASRCLLAVADQGGNVSLWRVRPHPDKYALVTRFKNIAGLPNPNADKQLAVTAGYPASSEVASVMPQSSQAIPVNALRFAVPDARQKARAWLYTADSKGSLRCWDLSILFQRHGIVEDNLEELFQLQRSGQLAAAASLHRGAVLTDLMSSTKPGRGESPLQLMNTSQSAAEGKQQGQGGSEAFLTGVHDEEESEDDERRVATTMRTAIQASHDRAFGLTEVSGNHQDKAEVVMILERTEGHSDAVVSMHMASSPNA
jgi:hypothetical protein